MGHTPKGKVRARLYLEGRDKPIELSTEWEEAATPKGVEKGIRFLGAALYTTYKIALGLPPFHGLSAERREDILAGR